MFVRSAFLRHIEDTHDSVASSDCKHFSTVAEVGREARPGQVVDSVARFKEAVSVEDLDLVAARAACNNQVVRILLELSCVELDW